MPDQRVNFQHGSLSEVVDHEPEPCGCPAMPVTSVASTGKYRSKSRSARKASRWPFLNAGRYRLSHSGERGLGAAPHSAHTCGPCGTDPCRGDRSPYVQR